MMVENAAAQGVCDRTTQVRDKLMESTGVSDCAQVTREHLADLVELDLSGTGITMLQAGDFFGLSSLRALWLNNNSLEELPEGVFDDVLDTLNDLRVDPQLRATLYFERTEQKTVGGASVEVRVWFSRPLPVAVRVPYSVSGTATEDGYTSLSPSPSTGVLFRSRYGIQTISLMVSESRENLEQTIVLTLGDLSRIELGRSDEVGSYSPQLKAESLIERPAERAVHTISIAYPNEPADICDRTPQVRGALIEAIPGVSSCREATTAQLASLIYLRLGASGIVALQEHDFKGLIGMRGLFLEHNSLSSLPEGVFHGLDSLANLRLNNNSLTTLPEGIFTGLDLLLELRLQTNILSSLPEGVFDGLSSLRWLSLFDNPLSDLPEGVFSGLNNLREILLGDNRLSELPPRIFDGLGSLERLWLFGNSLTNLPEGIFSGLSKLEELELGSNRFKELSGDVFKGMNNLEILNLGRNDLTSLPEGVFTGLNSLKILILQTNELSSLPENVFRGLYSLEHLWLNVNNLSELPEAIFADLSLLEGLLLHQNSLDELPGGIFSGLGRLWHMRLHLNPFGSLPEEVFEGLSSLRFLRLTGCELSHLPTGIFDGLDSLEYLFLEANPLEVLPTGIFDDVLDTLENIRIDPDLKAQLTFPQGAQRVASGTAIKVPVVLSRALPVAVRVPYRVGVSGSTAGLTGFSPSPDGGLVFPAGEIERDISFTLPKDSVVQGERTVLLALGDVEEIGLRRSDGAGPDAPYLETETLLLDSDLRAMHTLTVYDIEPDEQDPFCLSLWDGAPCSTVTTLPYVFMGSLGESMARTELVVTHRDPQATDCEVAVLFHQGTAQAPAVSFDGQFPNQNLHHATVPRGGAEILALTAPDAEDTTVGALSVFTRSPCTAGSLHLQGRALLENQVDGEVDELYSLDSRSSGDLLADGDCRRWIGRYANGEDVVLAMVPDQPGQSAPPGTQLHFRAFDLKGNLVGALDSLEVSGRHQALSFGEFDRPTIIETCLDVPGVSSFQLAVSVLGIRTAGTQVQFSTGSLPGNSESEDTGSGP